MSKDNQPLADDREEPERDDPYFYFDLADESHQALVEEARNRAMEAPLEPIQEVTKVEY